MFAIVLSSLIGYLLMDNITSNHVVVYAVIMEIFFFILRPIFYHIMYSKYHINNELSIEEVNNSVRDPVRNSNLRTDQ